MYLGIAIGTIVGGLLTLALYLHQYIVDHKDYVRDRRIQRAISKNFPATEGILTKVQMNMVLQMLERIATDGPLIADIEKQVKRGVLDPVNLKRINSIICLQSATLLYRDVWKEKWGKTNLPSNITSKKDELNDLIIEGITQMITEEIDFSSSFPTYAKKTTDGKLSVWIKLLSGIISIRVEGKKGKTLAISNYIIDDNDEYNMFNGELIENARGYVKMVASMGAFSALMEDDTYVEM